MTLNQKVEKNKLYSIFKQGSKENAFKRQHSADKQPKFEF